MNNKAAQAALTADTKAQNKHKQIFQFPIAVILCHVRKSYRPH